MPTLTLMMGPPGSGKTHYRDLVASNPVIICPDDNITAANGGHYEWTWWRARDAWKLAGEQLRMALDGDRDVIFDAVFRKRKDRKKYIHMARSRGWAVQVVYVKTDVEVCVARNALRPPNRRVPEDRLRQMAAEVEVPSGEEGINHVVIFEGDGGEE